MNPCLRQIQIILENELSEIGRLGQELQHFAESIGLSPKIQMQLQLILEELVTNIMRYGYADENRHYITVRVQLQDGDLVVEVEDDGRPFNPLEAAPPDLNLSLEAMPVGGLGLHLVRNLTSELRYERKQEKNRLLLRKPAGLK
jgi:serine/threonine-protein kinase RsbW